MSSPLRSSTVPPPALRAERTVDPENACEVLLSYTRPLEPDARVARDAWYEALALDGKEEVLFELEVLLKGLVCFSNPRNHPGPARRSPIAAIDFAGHAALWREGASRVVTLARALLEPKDRGPAVQRYLETALPEELSPAGLVRISSETGSPGRSLFALQRALTQSLELGAGLAHLPRVPFRLFYALLSTARRDVEHNAHFNPLSALEFRPEFDRIASPEVLELIAGVPGQSARHLVALTFLSLLRMLRYLRLLEAIARPAAAESTPAEPALAETTPALGRTFLVLAVLRSDARALSDYLRRSAGRLLAESFERDLLLLPAPALQSQREALREDARRLVAMRAALEGIAANLRIEMRRGFERDLPGPESGLTEDDILERVRAATAELAPTLESAVLCLAKALGRTLSPVEVFGEGAERGASERLRRDLWMFAQVVRAFAAKAAHARPGEDRWGVTSGTSFVKDFLAYFQALGTPLLRAVDDSRLGALLSTVRSLDDVDLSDPKNLEPAVSEATALYESLLGLVDEVSRRPELSDVPFDPRAAAQVLRSHLRA